MQHVVQEANSSAHGDLLGRGELCGMTGILRRDNALLRGLCFLGICWRGEVGGGLVRREDATVQGERHLDFGLVSDARDDGGTCLEGHGGQLEVVMRR